MKLAQFFISRPIFAGVLSSIILIAGLIALPNLPISEYPEVVPPTVVVKASYPGANPEVIADTVASPLEQSINGVENMLYQSSQATADGLMTLTVTFGRDESGNSSTRKPLLSVYSVTPSTLAPCVMPAGNAAVTAIEKASKALAVRKRAARRGRL